MIKEINKKNIEINEASIIIVLATIFLILLGGFGMMGLGNNLTNIMMGGTFRAGAGLMLVFMSIIWILTTVSLILLIAWFVKQLQNPRRKDNGRTKR